MRLFYLILVANLYLSISLSCPTCSLAPLVAEVARLLLAYFLSCARQHSLQRMEHHGVEEASDDGVEEEQQDVIVSAPTEKRQLHAEVRLPGVAEETGVSKESLGAMPAVPPPKVAKLLSAGSPPTLATVVQSPRLATVVQARAATAAQAMPSSNLASRSGTPAAPRLVSSVTPRQLQPGQGALQQAMAPAQAGPVAMGMVQGQPWGAWPVMMQAGPGGQPGMMVQWMPTAAMSTPRREVGVDGGGLPVRVVCRGCGLVRFDVEGRRWVHNHRQGKGNKQFACNRALCGCGQGDICPNRGQPHDPVAPGAVPAPALFAWNPGHGVSCQSSLPPLLSNPGTAAPATTVALAGGRLAAASTEGAATVAALLMIGGSGEGSTPCSLSTPHGDGSGASDFGGRSGGGDDDGSSGSGQTQSTGSGQSTGSLAL